MRKLTTCLLTGGALLAASPAPSHASHWSGWLPYNQYGTACGSDATTARLRGCSPINGSFYCHSFYNYPTSSCADLDKETLLGCGMLRGICEP
jgi:hypothetical protein